MTKVAPTRLEEGYAPSLASGLMGDFRDVHGATDDQVRIVIVARRLGTPLVFGDALWEKFPLGEDTKMNDRDGNPFRRNPFYRPRDGASPESASDKLEALQRAHLLAVPFENLDIHLGRPSVLDPARLFEKVVAHRRGGVG